MLSKVVVTSALPLVIASGAFSAEFHSKKGSITRTGSYATQFISVTNNGNVLVRAIRVECGFFRGDEFLVAGSGIATRIEPKQTAYVEVIANNAATATKTDCRVVAADD